MKYRVVAERRGPVLCDGRPIRNPFLIRDIFDPRLKATVERRVWDCLEFADEAELRRRFAEAVTTLPDFRGFEITKVESLPPGDAEARG